MNGLTGQLPEWMRSPAALIAGGLILLFLLILVLRRKSDAGGYGLPSGRGWRGKVPLPSQASSLERMRAALEASGRIGPARPSASPSPAQDDAGAVRGTLADATPASDAGATRATDGEVGNAEVGKPDEDADTGGDDSAKVVPLHTGTPSSADEGAGADDETVGVGDEAVGGDDEAVGSHAHAVGAHERAVGVASRKRARKRKG